MTALRNKGMGHAMKHFIHKFGLALLAFSLLFVAGCPQVIRALPTVVSTVQEAAMVLDTIEDFSRGYFVVKPDAEKQKKVSQAIAKCRAALSATLHATSGAQEFDQKDYDASFAEFKKAYEELLNVVGPLGVRQAGALSAAPTGDSLEVPGPDTIASRAAP